MNCHIALPFATITPARLVAYLQAHGWEQLTKGPGPDAHWYRKQGRWLLVPLRQDYDDYPDRIRDAIGAIAADEQGCCREVFARVAAEQDVTP